MELPSTNKTVNVTPYKNPKISLDLSNIEVNRKIGQTSKFKKNENDKKYKKDII